MSKGPVCERALPEIPTALFLCAQAAESVDQVKHADGN
jgi:hypothetical protein